MNHKKITLDTERKSFESIIAMQGDNKSRYIDATIVNRSIPVDLTGCAVKFSAIKPDITDIFNDAVIIDAKGGKVQIELTNQTLAKEGVIQATLVILKEDMQLSVLPFFITVIENPYNPNAIESKPEYQALNNALIVADGYAKELQDASVNLEEKYTTRLNNFGSQLDKKANNNDVRNKYYDAVKGLDTETPINDFRFRRLHSRSLNKNLKYHMSSMDFTKDFVNLLAGNMYQELETTNTLTQTITNGKFNLSNNGDTGSQSRRVLGKFNLFSTYEISIENIIRQTTLGVRCGINLINKVDDELYNIFVSFNSLNKLEVRSEMFKSGVSQGIIVNHTEDNTDNKATLLFTVLRDRVDVYIVIDNIKRFLVTVNIAKTLNTINLINRTTVALYTRLNPNESVTYTKFENYYDNGISQGDIKPIRYKNGSTLIKNGRIYFTASSRFQRDSYQTIISQNISGDDYRLEGILMFVVNNKIGHDIASSILYDNDNGKFLIWNTSFNNNHILSYGEAYCDVIHGINFIDMTLMEEGLVNDTDFKAKYGDEDPDFFYNYETKKWNLIICRLTYVEEESKEIYRYYLFESDEPFHNYVFKQKTLTGANTGGSIVKISNQYYIICGSNYHVTSQYNIYNLNDLSTFKSLLFDYADGGYRGWGTVFPIPCGNYTKYGWITFDRESEGQTQWTYGNIYYYESDMLNKGCEYNIKYSY